jgi:hypothetical protein
MCAPHPGVGYIDAAEPNGGDHLGVGDVFVDEVLLAAPPTDDFGRQRAALLGCAVDGMRAVYGATARVHGAMGGVEPGAVDTTRHVTAASCWGQRATNQALAIGFGLHKGNQPNEEPLLASFPELAEGLPPELQTDQGFPVAIIAFAFSTFRSKLALPQLNEEQTLAFVRDGAAAATLAAARGVDPSTALLTDLASGGLPPIAGIVPNGAFARGGGGDPTRLPMAYADPFLPWTLDEPGAEGERKQALALLFADGHARDRCAAFTESDLTLYVDAVTAAENGGDANAVAAACDQCVLMLAPHLRFGIDGDHDLRREALCALVPGATAFVYTEDDPAAFTGSEPTDFASLAAATRERCGCPTTTTTTATSTTSTSSTSTTTSTSTTSTTLACDATQCMARGTSGFCEFQCNPNSCETCVSGSCVGCDRAACEFCNEFFGQHTCKDGCTIEGAECHFYPGGRNGQEISACCEPGIEFCLLDTVDPEFPVSAVCCAPGLVCCGPSVGCCAP